MNCPAFHERLAEYLADELPAADRSAAEAHAAECADCRRMASELAAAEQVLRSGIVADALSEAAVRGLSLPRVAGRHGPVVRMTLMPLRYAAMIAAGFLAGYALRGSAAPDTRSPAPAVGGVHVASAVHHTLVSRYQAAEAAYPEAPAFSRSLVALARP